MNNNIFHGKILKSTDNGLNRDSVNTGYDFSAVVDSRIRGNDNVILKVFDLLGKEVTTLVNENLQPGNYEVIFNASGLASGIYFNKLTAGKYSDVKKMLYIR